MDKKIFLYILSFVLTVNVSALASVDSQYGKKPNDLSCNSQLQNYILHVPAGIKTTAILSQDINSKTALVGQPISAILTKDLKYNNELIAPSDSVISGNIVFNKRAGLSGKGAQMQIRFTTIRTPYNNIIPINALIETNDSTGIIKAADIKNTSSIAETAVALDGALEAAKTITTKGNNILIPANSTISLVFDQPITLGAP